MKTWFPGYLLEGAAVSLGLRILGAVLGFAFNVIVARSLGISDAGSFFLVIAVMNILPIVARFGVDTVAAREAAIAHDAGNLVAMRGVANLSVLVILAGSVFFSSILWLSAPFLGEIFFDGAEIAPLLQIAALAVFPVAVQKVFSDLLLVTQRLWQSQFIQMLLPQLANCLAFYILAKNFGVGGGVWAVVVAASVTALIAALLWWGHEEYRSGAYTTPDFSKFLKSCWQSMGVAVAGLGISAVSTVFLGAYGSREDVAMFSVAMRIAMLSNFIAFAIQNASIRRFSILHSSGASEELRKSAGEARLLSSVLCSCLLIPVMIFSDPLMGIFGEEFRAGGDILIVLCIGQLLVGFFGPVMPLLLMSGNEKVVRNCTMVAALINIPLHMLLIPMWGAIGAGFAFSLSFSGATAALAFFAGRRGLS